MLEGTTPLTSIGERSCAFSCWIYSSWLCPPSPSGGWATDSSNEPIECSQFVSDYQQNVQGDNPQVNFVEQNVHLHSHDPALTSLVETTAELRRREVLAKAEAHAEAVHMARTEELVEALRVREGIESQRAQDAMIAKEHEMNRMGVQFRENLKHEAHQHVKFREAQMSEKIQAYQRVIDANHRQSLSIKEQEILELKRQAEEERRIQNDRITQLEQMVQTQMQHNLKLQSMLDSQFAQARPAQVVETAAMTTTAEAFTSSATGSEFVRLPRQLLLRHL